MLITLSTPCRCFYAAENACLLSLWSDNLYTFNFATEMLATENHVAGSLKPWASTCTESNTGFIIHKERQWISNIKIFCLFFYIFLRHCRLSLLFTTKAICAFDDAQRMITFSYNVQWTKLFLSLVCIQHLNWVDYLYHSWFATYPQQQRRARQENLYTLMSRVKVYLFKICVHLRQSASDAFVFPLMFLSSLFSTWLH